MRKFIILLLVFFLFHSAFCFSQERSKPVVINKQVELIEYDYHYVFVEILSSIHYSLYYPVLTFGKMTENQQFYEEGRNIRTGFDFGFSQNVKFGRWALSGGISFLQYNEFFSYNEYETRQLTIQNQDGTLQTISVVEGNPVSYSRNNRLGYLKIPLGFSFHPNFYKSKLGIGMLFNYHYLLSADYMTKYSTIEEAGFVAPNDFNTSFLSLSGNLLFHMKIVKNISLTIEPYFDYGLGKIINQKDLTFGMNEIGIRTGLSLCY